MRYTLNNILFVKQITRDGNTTEWFVTSKNRIGTSYCGYELNELPVTIRKFIERHEREIFAEDYWRGSHFVHYIYRA